MMFVGLRDTPIPPGQIIPPANALPPNVTIASLNEPWYMTWWGLGLIGAGAFFGYRWYKGRK